MFGRLVKWWNGKPDEIVSAAKKNDVAKVKNLLASKADVNFRKEDPYDDMAQPNSGFTALWKVCDRATPNTTECITLLLEAKADPNFNNRFGTCLQVLAAEGNTSLMQLLIDYKADVNLSDKTHRDTPLHMAARVDNSESVRLLLDNKADPTLRNKIGYTALKEAEQHPDSAIIQMLRNFTKDKEEKREASKTAEVTQSPAVQTAPRPF